MEHYWVERSLHRDQREMGQRDLQSDMVRATAAQTAMELSRCALHDAPRSKFCSVSETLS